jgi:hypothetical protein
MVPVCSTRRVRGATSTQEGPRRVIASMKLISPLSLWCLATGGSSRPPASISTHINEEHDNEGKGNY